MSISLSIDHNTCIRCGKCVKVCPAHIFHLNEGSIALQGVQNCIVCGHCVAVCPTWSVIHGDFPKEKVHEIDRAGLPTPQQMLTLIQARRSNRALTNKPVPQQAVELILEAAHRAPTASNQQELSYTVVRDPKKVKKIIEYTLDTFMEIVGKVRNPVLRPVVKLIAPEAIKMAGRFEALKKEYEKGGDPILRGGTTVIFIHSPEESRFGCQDANLAYQNGSLMAESLGISQIYTGFVCTAIGMDKKNRIANMLGIKGTVHAGMALGVPEFLYPRYIDKKGIEVKEI